ncbi:MAG: hypothetical protein KGH89_09495 [Thaumarchaeota archaeon]|nr:hypothetical protein [Nitrososphaerota archaeon]
MPFQPYSVAVKICTMWKGLSTYKGIVEAHGGRISVQSKVSEGSMFSFTIPKSEFSKTPL